jgi:murein DD-endopeptidase MepM/ murein hydrolase activator NlpD
LVATVVVGGAIAATGQHALAETLPDALNGVDALGDQLFSTASAATVIETAAAVPAVDVVAPEPVVADAAALVKAADLQRAAAEASAAEAARAAAEKAAAAAPVQQAKEAVASVGGAVQMIAGRVTSGFGSRWGAAHQGLDIAASIGTPIRAPLAGTVIDSGPASGFGLWVRLRHADGTTTVYGHINRSLVKVGDEIAAGEVIAEVGNRGQSTGPHLHIEVVTPGGKKVNPRPWLDQHGIRY